MLAILTTHPIQYQVPLWQAIARDGRIPFEVWYLSRYATDVSRDREFGQSFAWDLDMLSGYPHRFLDVVPNATPNNFWKCRVRESLAERMRDAKAKALWIQGWQVAAYWQAVWAAKKIGAEVWLRGESNDLAPTPIWKRAIKRAVLGQLFRRVDRFLYIGRANKRLYEKFGVPQERLYSAPYAVDNDRFARQANEIRNSKFEIRKQWKIPEDAFCVLFCGKFIPKKRPLDLIAAARGLITSNQLSNIHLFFVGSGELGAELRANCNVVFDQEGLGLTSDLRPLTSGTKPSASFAGFLNQTEISKAYVAPDCLVLPSDYRETWGLVVNEAMASGLPCIISDQCGCAEDLGRFSSNETFRSGNIRAFAEEIIALSTGSHPESSRVEFWNAYSFENTVDTTVQLYQGIARDDGSL
jgi:glycosyltransferase involved in cell wall biosynthesis